MEVWRILIFGLNTVVAKAATAATAAMIPMPLLVCSVCDYVYV